MVPLPELGFEYMSSKFHMLTHSLQSDNLKGEVSWGCLVRGGGSEIHAFIHSLSM